MQMFDALAAVLPAVVDYSVTVRKSRLFRDLRYDLENLCDKVRVLLVYRVGAADMRFRHDKYMRRRLRIYVAKAYTYSFS